MPSQIETAILRHRTALLNGDQAVLKAVQRAYDPIREKLLATIEELVTEIERSGVTTGTQALKLERATALLEQTQDELQRLSGPMNGLITTAQRQAIHASTNAAAAMVEAQAPSLATAFNRLNTEGVSDLVGRLSDGSPMRSWLDNLGPQSANSIEEALKSAVGLGTNPRAVAAQLGKLVDLPGNRLLRLARTEVLNTYRSSAILRYQQNSDIVRGWRWIAANSARTCSACLALSGREFDLSVSFQPSHPNCRCSSIPILKGVPFPQFETGSEWFAKQPESTQDHILGIEGGAAYRSGEVDLDDFATLHRNDKWGDSYRQASAETARQHAARRTRRAA